MESTTPMSQVQLQLHNSNFTTAISQLQLHNSKFDFAMQLRKVMGVTLRCVLRGNAHYLLKLHYLVKIFRPRRYDGFDSLIFFALQDRASMWATLWASAGGSWGTSVRASMTQFRIQLHPFQWALLLLCVLPGNAHYLLKLHEPAGRLGALKSC